VSEPHPGHAPSPKTDPRPFQMRCDLSPDISYPLGPEAEQL